MARANLEDFDQVGLQWSNQSSRLLVSVGKAKFLVSSNLCCKADIFLRPYIRLRRLFPPSTFFFNFLRPYFRLRSHSSTASSKESCFILVDHTNS